MFKKYTKFIVLLFFLICCVFLFYTKYEQQSNISLITTDKEDILNNKIAVIKNINIENIQEIKVSVGADNACDLEYTIKEEEIKAEQDNTISIPVYYLVADKISNININIKLKNNKIINKKIKTKVDVKNNTSIKYYDSIPDIVVGKVFNNNVINKVYKITYLVWKKKQCICIFFIDFDIYGNIRKISYFAGNDEEINRYLYELDRMKIEHDNSILRFPYGINGENLMEVDKNTNKIIKTFNLKTILGLDYGGEDWLHPNSLAYDKTDDTILISSRHLGGGSIIKIDKDGDLIYVLTDPKYFLKKETEHLKKYLLKPIFENNFEWSYKQHSIMCLDNKHILLFDNGGDRNENIRGFCSRAVIYEIDERNMTVKQIWQYGKELGEKFYSLAHGNVCFDNKTKTVLINSPLIVINLKEKKSVCNIREVDITNNNLLLNVYIKPKNLYFEGEGSYLDYAIYVDKIDI